MGRIRLLVLVLLLPSLMVSGCFERDHGPLNTFLVAHEWQDVTNLSFTVGFHNSGEVNITKIEVHIDAIAAFPREMDRKAIRANISGLTGSYKLHREVVFNESDVLLPDETRHVALVAEFPPELEEVPLSVREQMEYRISASVDYQDAKTRWGYIYDLPCIDSRGELHSKTDICDDYSVFGEKKPE